MKTHFLKNKFNTIIKILILVIQQFFSFNFFIRHWRGELSLGVSYWINTFLISNIIFIILLLISNYVGGVLSLRILAGIAIIVVFLFLFVWFWSVVGVWRSANLHVDRGGKSEWAFLAKFVVVIGFIGMAVTINNNLIPQVREYFLISTGNDSIGEVKVIVSNDGKSIVILGTLREGAAKKIITIIEAAPSVKELVLTSNGGRLYEAKLLAKEIRKRSLNTFVQDYCKSACTYLLLAGKFRGASAGAKIGFHRPTFPGLDDVGERAATKSMLKDYREAGLNNSFIKRINETPASDIWYPSRAELIQNKILTIDDSYKKMQVIVGTESADGMRSVFFDIKFLKEFERITIKNLKAKTSELLIDKEYTNIKYQINSKSMYVYSGGNKLLVVWLDESFDTGIKKEAVTAVIVAGIVNKEFVRISCAWKLKKKMSIINGQCGNRVKNIFGNLTEP